jgi:hypothetical protein
LTGIAVGGGGWRFAAHRITRLTGARGNVEHGGIVPTLPHQGDPVAVEKISVGQIGIERWQALTLNQVIVVCGLPQLPGNPDWTQSGAVLMGLAED